MIDGCTPIQIFFPGGIPDPQADLHHRCDPCRQCGSGTITCCHTWCWISKKYKTIPIVIQYLKGGYGSVDWGSMMAMLVFGHYSNY